MRAGFKIVTGIGSHSKNHAPRIGPAVTKMLVREGWRVEVGHGELLVTGKAKTMTCDRGMLNEADLIIVSSIAMAFFSCRYECLRDLDHDK